MDMITKGDGNLYTMPYYVIRSIVEGYESDLDSDYTPLSDDDVVEVDVTYLDEEEYVDAEEDATGIIPYGDAMRGARRTPNHEICMICTYHVGKRVDGSFGPVPFEFDGYCQKIIPDGAPKLVCKSRNGKRFFITSRKTSLYIHVMVCVFKRRGVMLFAGFNASHAYCHCAHCVSPNHLLIVTSSWDHSATIEKGSPGAQGQGTDFCA